MNGSDEMNADDDSPAGHVNVRFAVKLITLFADSVEARKLCFVVDAQAAQAGKAALEDTFALGAGAGAVVSANRRRLMAAALAGRCCWLLLCGINQTAKC